MWDMAKAYSQDLRDRVIEAALLGPSLRQVAARFDIAVSTAIGWVGRLRDSGECVARRQGRPRGLKLDPHRDFLLPLIAAEPDMTIQMMQDRLLDERGVKASIGTIWTFLDRCKLSFKKKTAHASEQDRPDVLKQREDWFEGQLDLDPAKLVFIDETWASTNMAPLRGWAPKGERLRVGIPHGHWKRTTFIAGLRLTGLTAPMVLDGSINGTSFLDWVRRVLVPTLSPGDTVVADNLTSHKGDEARKAIEAAGATIRFLPAYSPDFNPIEKAFAKIKAQLRRAAERSVAALWKTIMRLARLFTPDECANFFAACGYDQD
jgi:transposase